jgi:hypothetical protein
MSAAGRTSWQSSTRIKTVKRFSIVSGMAAAATLAGCAVEMDGGELGDLEAAITACAAPAAGTGALCNVGGGELTFQVTLPSGQQYVEVFARQNGVQNVATAIQASGVDHGDGTTTYALTRGGYTAGDDVQYRFYSYRPASAGVFTPGPVEAAWYTPVSSSTVTVPVAKDAAVISSSYGTGPVPNRNFGAAATVDIGEYHLVSEGLFGYSLASVGAVTGAELVIPPATVPGASNVTLRLNVVTSAWDEATVTWNTRPSYQFVREVLLAPYAENRIDVTAEVAAAAGGEISFALQPSGSAPSTDNIFIDAKEKVGGAPTFLEITAD